MRSWHPLTRLLVVVAVIGIAALPFLDPAAPEIAGVVEPAGAPSAAADRTPVPPLPPLESFTATVGRPLFSPARQAAALPLPPVAEAPAPLVEPMPVEPALSLQGIIVAGPRRLALLGRSGGGEIATLAEGDTLDGWIVERIEGNRVTLRGGDQSTTLHLFPTVETP